MLNLVCINFYLCESFFIYFNGGKFLYFFDNGKYMIGYFLVIFGINKLFLKYNRLFWVLELMLFRIKKKNVLIIVCNIILYDNSL